MKTFRNISVQIAAVLLMFLAIPKQGDAQIVNNMYFNADWQINVPLGNNFANKASGWGANFEAGYYLTPNVTLGAFISYMTNHKYVGRETLSISNSSVITGDQQHSIFQLPFGASMRYSFAPYYSMFEPYASIKLGANYSEMSTYMNIFKIHDDTWGFYLSPELGLNIFPNPEKRFGFHIAAYYSYATNKASVLTYTKDNLNNFGVRIGVIF